MRKTLSTMMLFLLITSIIVAAFRIQSVEAAATTIIINADGSISPSTAPISSVDKVTYTFTGDISYPVYNGIVVEKGNIIIDGKGYTVQGNAADGINVTSVNDVTIKNTNIQGFTDGIHLESSSNNVISGNTVSNNTQCGIYLNASSNNVVSWNKAIANTQYGIWLNSSSNNNSVNFNNASANSLTGVYLSFSSNKNIVTGNTATSNYDDGIALYSYCLNNVVSGNNASANGMSGIFLWGGPQGNIVSWNTAASNAWYGLWLWASWNNTVSWNTASANGLDGAFFNWCAINAISSNIATANNVGVYLYGDSYSNTLSSNNITANNQYGIYVNSSSNNNIYHNNFVNNKNQVRTDGSPNVWDNGFPSGGNYWSDYSTRYPGASEIDSSGIWNTPYVIDVNNTDNNPLMQAYVPPTQTVYIDADGSISPVDAPIATAGSITYSLTGNISYPTYNGIIIERSNIIIDGRGYAVQGNQSGKGLCWQDINNVTVENANVNDFTYGFWLYSSSNSSIIGNNITANSYYGIIVISSLSSSIIGNNITANTDAAILLGNPGSASNYSIISGNNLANSGIGIYLSTSFNNSISGNNITANSDSGIQLNPSSGNSIIGNNIADNLYGIAVSSSSTSNSISGNNITANSYCGIALDSAYSNTMYHNNFMSNANQVVAYYCTDAWDDGYPSGGNYWSGYAGTDLFSGPYQNVTGSDGIGDTPYVIDSNNKDRYPLMQPWTGPAPTSMFINFSISLVSVGSNVICSAIVSGVNVYARATGTVTWSTSSSTGNFSTTVCTLSSGSCNTTYNDSSPGSVTIAAYYGGDLNYQPCSGSSTLTVVSTGHVYYSKDYSSVQAAINASAPGSNLIVAPGICYEKLILDKKLTLIGDPDQAEFGGGGSGIFLTVYSGASGSIVTGFEITSYDDGIIVYASNCQVYSNTMSSMVESGIVLDGSNATGDVVYDNAFENTPTPINLTASAGGNTIYGNIISSQATVTISVGTNDNTVYQNVISGSSIVLNLTNSQGNTFYHDDFLATTQITATGPNAWDDGSSGNYWSDYQAKYPNAAEVDSSGIWNTHYVINGNNKDNCPLMKPYAPSVGHETAVTLVVSTKTVIMQGYTGSVTVTASNRGQYTETFTVTAYGNNTTIGTQQVANLGSAGQITLTFTWNTTGYAIGKYTINAYAEPVQGETDIANSNFTDGLIYVSMVGDLTGASPFVPDGKCDGRDITVVAKCFGTGIGDARYNPNCDILNRGKIDGRDITIVAKNFGKHDP